MKPRLVNMLTITKELIINNPQTRTFIKRNRAAMNDRISIMFSHNLVKIIARFPLQHAWLRFITDHKRCIDTDRVLLETINLHGGMIRGGTKFVSLRKVC